MMLKKVSLLGLFLLLFFSFDNLYASNEITILKYSKQESELVEKLNFTLTWNLDKNIQLVNDKYLRKIYIKIMWIVDKKSIDLQISYQDKSITKTIEYKPKFPYSIDLNSKVWVKRIQNKPLSCEFSIASDILTYLEKNKIDEDELIAKVDKTYFNILPTEIDGKIYWWNPDKWFVWYMDYYVQDGQKTKPSQWKMTWYWVYEKPISQIFNSYWYETEIINKNNYLENFWEKEHLTLLLKNLAVWNMIQLWWDRCTKEEIKTDLTFANNSCYSVDYPRNLEWYYVENFEIKKHEGLNWEHAFFLLWYEWWVENPTNIIVWDSDTWYHKYSINEWFRKWNLIGNRSLIIKNNF